MIDSKTEVIHMTGILLLGILIVTLLMFFISNTYRSLKTRTIYIFEYFKLNFGKNKTNPTTKIELHNIINNINSPTLQKIFLRKIKERGAMLSGQWPENKTPELKNQEANDIMAELEEKWLKLK